MRKQHWFLICCFYYSTSWTGICCEIVAGWRICVSPLNLPLLNVACVVYNKNERKEIRHAIRSGHAPGVYNGREH